MGAYDAFFLSSTVLALFLHVHVGHCIANMHYLPSIMSRNTHKPLLVVPGNFTAPWNFTAPRDDR